MMFPAPSTTAERGVEGACFVSMYGEYSHILKHVIGCHITYFVLEDRNNFSIDANDLF